MRDLDRVRDKIEVRLEPRQVVMLAIGTMLFSGLLFAAGFMLGRSRAPAPPPPTLALGTVASEAVEAAAEVAPVRAAAIGEVTFEFPSMLGSRPGHEATRRQPMRLSKDVVPVTAPKTAEPEATEPKIAEAEAAEPAAPEPKVAARIPVEPVAPKPVAPKPAPIEPVAPAPVARRAAPPAPTVIEPEPTDEDDPDAAPPPAPEPVRPVEPAPAADARYTLQVKAARDKAEADAFIAELRKAGFKPHTVLAEVPGKGRFYRIRVGRFASMADARAFQRQYKRQSGQPDGGFVTDL